MRQRAYRSITGWSAVIAAFVLLGGLAASIGSAEVKRLSVEDEGQAETTTEQRQDTYGWLGVQIQNVNDSIANSLEMDDSEGSLVVRVLRDTPAEHFGVQRGDVILRVDGNPADDIMDLARQIQQRPGMDVVLTTWRDGEMIELEVSLDEKKGHPQRYSRYHRHSDSWHPQARAFQFHMPSIRISRPWLGVKLYSLHSESLASRLGVNAHEGALILDVIDGSPAEKAGLLPGDVIVEINGEQIKSPHEVSNAMRDADAGDDVEIIIIRDRSRMELRTTFSEDLSKLRIPAHQLRALDLQTEDLERDIRRSLRETEARLEAMDDYLEGLEQVREDFEEMYGEDDDKFIVPSERHGQR